VTTGSFDRDDGLLLLSTTTIRKSLDFRLLPFDLLNQVFI
jgi:hypothetical protein